MSLLFLLVACLTTSAVVDSRLQLTTNLTIPLHYDVELTIDVASRSFTAEESILITVPKDTNEIEIRSNELEVSWQSTRLVSEDGKEYKATEWADIPSISIIFLLFDETIPGGENYTLYITGIKGIFGAGLVEVSPDNVGDSSKMYLLSTGYDVTNLRAVFPCYDEPQYRTTFSFVIYYAEGYNLITNAEEIRTEGPILNRNKFMQSSFELNDPFPTSSIGFALTNMKVQSSPDNRVKVYHTDAQTAAVLLNNYHHLLLAVEEELQMPLECPKLDVIYVPTLPTKTLTKWGIILIGPEMNPVEKSTVYAIELKDIQKEMARSVYQLFFGQLVHPRWWTSQWFTLGLARYFAGVTKHLPFETEQEFVVDTVQMVLKLHDVYTSSNMGGRYNSLDDINNVDVFAVDQRPAAEMRMVANIMGRDRFNEAVRDFLADNRYSSVFASAFLEYLDLYTKDTLLPEGQTLSSLIFTIAYKVPNREALRIFRNQNKKIQMLRWGSVDVELPVDFMTSSIPAAGQPKFWIESFPEKTPILDIEDPWIVFNPQQYGVYVVEYDWELYVEFAKQLMADHTRFNRAQLISDCINQVARGISLAENYLNLIRYLPKETDLITWRVARMSFEHMLMSMRGFDGDMKPLYDYYNSLTSALYLKNRIRTEMKDFEMTLELAKIVCYSGLSECVEDVNEYFKASVETEKGLVGSSDFQTFIYYTLAKDLNNTELLVNHTMSLWVEDRRVHSQSRNAIRGLVCSADKGAIKEFLNVVVADGLQMEDGFDQTYSERFFLLHTLMRGSEEAVEESLTFILENFGAIQDLLHPINGLFHGINNYLRTQKAVDILNEITKIHVSKMDWRLEYDITKEADRGAAIGVRNNQYVQVNVKKWLENENEPGLGSRMKALNLLTLLAAIITLAFITN